MCVTALMISLLQPVSSQLIWLIWYVQRSVSLEVLETMRLDIVKIVRFNNHDSMFMGTGVK